jgi:hypothetical protein
MPSLERAMRRENKKKKRDKIRGEQQEPRIKSKRVRIKDE